jgi:hypothetical protein
VRKYGLGVSLGKIWGLGDCTELHRMPLFHLGVSNEAIAQIDEECAGGCNGEGDEHCRMAKRMTELDLHTSHEKDTILAGAAE